MQISFILRNLYEILSFLWFDQNNKQETIGQGFQAIALKRQLYSKISDELIQST